ncbi:type II toxin-antitoxin system RelB family antitoxin [Anoxynatronum sibiricum]|uniref:DUF6290 family protein n=1 Tax=Anoxynatronum sibiricum TaxID=210623 RepID=A0ABU9VX10_9CLOT
MSTVTVRLNKEEHQAFGEYAKLQGVSLPTLLKKTLEEKMEDELDMELIRQHEEDVKNNNSEAFVHDEVKKMLGL